MSKPNILILEDSRRDIAFFQQALEEGCNVTIATSQREAKAHIEQTHFDYIAVDACVNAKKPNTLGFIKFTRSSYRRPLIAISNSEKYRALQIEAGCTHQCSKEELPQLIRKLSEAGKDDADQDSDPVSVFNFSYV